MQRCFNPRNHAYVFYGGRGITVDERWRGKDGYPNFLADMGRRPEGGSLDRWPNPDGNYGPGNCRWATMLQQQNNRRGNKIVEFRGQRKTISEWIRELGLSKYAVYKRLNTLGFTVEEALTIPRRITKRELKTCKLPSTTQQSS